MINRKEFSDKVEKLMAGGKADVMSAILKVCEEHLLEPESAKRLLTNPLREKLEAEATKMNMVNRGRNSQGTLTSFYE
jgi:hypothetical protein